MKARLPRRVFHSPLRAEVWTIELCQRVHKAIQPVAYGSLLLGGLVAAAGETGVASFMIAAGLLFQFSVWFERWWSAASQA